MNNSHTKASIASRKQKALIYFNKKKYPQAGKIYREIYKASPQDTESCYMLGRIANRLGQYQEACDWLQKALKIEPHAHLALVELGNACKGQQNLPAAEIAYKQSLEKNPHCFEAWLGLGNVYQHNSQYRAALGAFQKALQANPDEAEPHYQSGKILLNEGNTYAAIAAFTRALKLQPRHAGAQAGLGECHYQDARFENAIEYYRQSLKLQPRDPDTRTKLGKSLVAAGRLPEAAELYEQIGKREPDNIIAKIGKAEVYARQRRYTDSRRELAPLLQTGLCDSTIAIVYSRICRHLNECDKAISLMEDMLASNETLSPEDRRILHFNLGKLYDAANAYDKAFKHYRQANEMLPFSYDPGAFESMLEALTRAFNRKTLAGLPHAAQRSDRPIFIVGMPRSGTTLVEQILGSHKDVHAGGELSYMTDIVKSLISETRNSNGYPACVGNISLALVEQLSHSYLSRIGKLSTRELLVTDKMPHNYIHLGLIEILFPQAKVIHCQRDPRDTCLSIYFQSFHASHSYSNDLVALATHYKQYQKLMDHWKLALSIPVYEIQYEAVVTNLESEARKLLEFCQLDWDPSCLKFYNARRIVNTASSEQVSNPIYRSSVGRWKNYSSHIQPLLSMLGHQKNT